MYLENQESVREKSGKSQGEKNIKVCGNPGVWLEQELVDEVASGNILVSCLACS